MCTYCMMGDHFFRHDPPWPNQFPYPTHPLIPAPVNPLQPITPWTVERLFELQDLLRRVKEMEDRLGCPCEPNKADYLGLLEQRIAALEKQRDPSGPRCTHSHKIGNGITSGDGSGHWSWQCPECGASGSETWPARNLTLG